MGIKEYMVVSFDQPLSLKQTGIPLSLQSYPPIGNKEILELALKGKKLSLGPVSVHSDSVFLY